MNAVYNLGPRLGIAKRWGKETLTGGGLNNAQFNDYVKDGPLTEFFQRPDTVWTPHVLKDGSDSVGALGALNRVYLNIGLFSEEWLLHFNALAGDAHLAHRDHGGPQELGVLAGHRDADAVHGSFLPQERDAPLPQGRAGRPRPSEQGRGHPHHGQDGVRRPLRALPLEQGPARRPGLDPAGCAGPGYMSCWLKYWEWTKTDEYKQQMRSIVMADDFLNDNFLSTDVRVPATLLETNACSPLATNAIGGNIWDNFSSQSYKDLPSVGTITVYNPFTGDPQQYTMPAGGRGYTRPASLVSLWSTAPFLQNNSVGKFDPSPSVEARLRSFDSSIEQMLWPEKRQKDAVLGDKIPGIIDRTTTRSYLRVAGGYLPPFLRPLLGPLHRYVPWLFGEGGVQIGPIPAGVPVDLFGNLELMPDGGSATDRVQHGGDSQAARRYRAQPAHPARAGHRRGGAPAVRRARRSAVQAQQVPGLRGQPRALLRHRRLQGGTWAQR